MKAEFLAEEFEKLRCSQGPRLSGRVTHAIGLLIQSNGPEAFVGEICYVYDKRGMPIQCEVVGFRERQVLLMSHAGAAQIAPGAEVFPTGHEHRVAVSPALIGRVLDGLGQPIDGKGELGAEKFYPVMAPPPSALLRQPITEILETKIKAIDGFLTIGKGQRIGIFSEPGIGKSTLMGMIARFAKSHVNVIALIGERGREVREFIERGLGPEGLARSVVIVVTSDQAPLLRSKGANIATAIAEYFRDLGNDVVLMMDSLSRYAMALREIGLAIGEPPTTRGYTPSVFASLPRLLERSGNSQKGSITGIYTILCEDDDPIPAQLRSLLDGHIDLSKQLAEGHHFPPIDVLKSLSRVMSQITTLQHQEWAGKLRRLMHVYAEAHELLELGAYTKGTNPRIDEAIEKIAAIEDFLQQEELRAVNFTEMLEQIKKIVDQR